MITESDSFEAKAKAAVESWWRTGLNYGPPVELAPSQENKPSIPFLQMANGGTNKLGCAFNICGDKDDPNSLAYVLFVCKYGEEQIQVGTPIYTDGPPCGSCEDRCYQTRLCKTQ
ncbi:hypothetical protein DICVIV_01374 [Dictyocaulus viviparus]|uniref:SCP domain-containing protein n=1 Tax=Dictyocaulus viviparus TaxID=29172 RepID=A0A0D8Y871_DICVI|nr:hypothetical protein DICVIV_01374 [Dictyocaulus viviparus]